MTRESSTSRSTLLVLTNVPRPVLPAPEPDLQGRNFPGNLETRSTDSVGKSDGGANRIPGRVPRVECLVETTAAASQRVKKRAGSVRRKVGKEDLEDLEEGRRVAGLRDQVNRGG